MERVSVAFIFISIFFFIMFIFCSYTPIFIIVYFFYFFLFSLVAVRFSKTTTVNWESFGLSIEPNGHCDNFFIAGFCRKHFEDIHPRLSKKHFFYPKVGVIILQLFIWFCFAFFVILFIVFHFFLNLYCYYSIR
jgi:hypothetical protein